MKIIGLEMSLQQFMKLSPKKIKDLGNSLKNYYVPNNIPGFSVLVNQDSKEIYYSESGLIDVNRKRKINRDSILGFIL